jgi:hypothetical protein
VQGQYEKYQLDTIPLPTKNNRIRVGGNHSTETRQIAEKDTSISEIISYCKDMPESMIKRMVTLKQFQDLLKSANPERTYDFMDRNYTESHDIETFRQLLVDYLVLDPDVTCCHYDKRD